MRRNASGGHPDVTSAPGGDSALPSSREQGGRAAP